MQTSYNGMVHAFCGVTPAQERVADRLVAPPAHPQADEYALDDVRYLIDAYDVIRERLDRVGRAVLGVWTSSPAGRPRRTTSSTRALAFKRVKRVNSLTRRQLAVARELAAWREARAERADIPRKWLMSDEVLAGARQAPAA